jgi:hypothetical protein
MAELRTDAARARDLVQEGERMSVDQSTMSSNSITRKMPKRRLPGSRRRAAPAAATLPRVRRMFHGNRVLERRDSQWDLTHFDRVGFREHPTRSHQIPPLDFGSGAHWKSIVERLTTAIPLRTQADRAWERDEVFKHPTPNIQHRTPNGASDRRLRLLSLDVGCWVLGVGCWVLDVSDRAFPQQSCPIVPNRA